MRACSFIEKSARALVIGPTPPASAEEFLEVTDVCLRHCYRYAGMGVIENRARFVMKPERRLRDKLKGFRYLRSRGNA